MRYISDALDDYNLVVVVTSFMVLLMMTIQFGDVYVDAVGDVYDAVVGDDKILVTFMMLLMMIIQFDDVYGSVDYHDLLFW